MHLATVVAIAMRILYQAIIYIDLVVLFAIDLGGWGSWRRGPSLAIRLRVRLLGIANTGGLLFASHRIGWLILDSLLFHAEWLVFHGSVSPTILGFETF